MPLGDEGGSARFAAIGTAVAGGRAEWSCPSGHGSLAIALYLNPGGWGHDASRHTCLASAPVRLEAHGRPSPNWAAQAAHDDLAVGLDDDL
jgi:hypothetical protein